ncbi:enhancer of mRNA-decapping protein 4 isoform X2 [Trichoplusia ni]|uniref:Enhancer of mRNA-decapping protein 4 isoform X2 n=1 Tax=Trichoplusia ni TaxID=7111 RepID=A0A7E5WB77_TRINI|nr:enhancer of mRNA-decapping protein 4 isoform X2 [Trichoplusia ni]
MAPTTMLPKLSDATQTISFSDGDGVCSSEVYSTNVLVNTNAGNHDHGSSKVKLKNLVDYNWEPKFYAGQILAIHTSGKYLAYSIKAPNAVNPGTWSGMVRVVYTPEPGTDRRALIKGMKGEVQDLAFAHIQNQVILASIDEQGNFYVHEIEVTDSGLRCTLLSEVQEDSGAAGSSHRVVWCPYIPDDDEETSDDDVARLLLTTNDHIARIWNTRSLSGSSSVSGRAAGAMCAAEHAAAILDAAFSPDGSALATASADGYVMFFQVYVLTDSSPRCLHKWQPHGGKPLSCLFFLDNHKNYNTDVQFWKFAVTGSENNTNIKIWSCKSWTCLQTITFTPGLGTEGTLGLKAMLDTSASYLLLSDFKSRSLYVLNMARDPEDSLAYCKSISEFLLPYPVLSFCIVDAEEQLSKCEPSCDEPYHRNGSSGDADSPIDYEMHHDESGSVGSCGSLRRRVCVRLYIVQPKGLQEGRLVYSPPRPPLHADLMHGEIHTHIRHSYILYIVQPKGLQEGRLVYSPPRPPLHADLMHGEIHTHIRHSYILYIVQPKGLQEGRLVYSPPRPPLHADLMHGEIHTHIRHSYILYIVQPKGLQEGRLVYSPPRPPLHADLMHGEIHTHIRHSYILYIVQPKGLQEGRLVYSPPRPPLHADLMHGEIHTHIRHSYILYIVQPKGLQEGRLVYSPPRPPLHADLMHGLSELALEDSSSESAPATIASSILQQQSQQLKNLLMRSQTQPGSLIGQRPESPTIAPQLNLMTPDAFSSPGKREEDDPPLSVTPDVSNKPRNSTAGSCVEESLCEAASKLASAGSSPSREVQQIMAHNEHAFFKEEEAAPAEGAELAAPLFAGPEPYAPLEPAAPAHKLPHTNSETWPQISIPQIAEANQRKASSDKSSNQSGNTSLNASGAERDEARGAGLAPADKTRLEALEHKLDKLTEMVSNQSRELRSLRGAVTSPREMIDEALHAHAQRTAAAVESALADGWERISRVGEAASARAAQAAGVGAARALEPLAAALQSELATKISATDQLLRDNIDKLATSKTVMERLSTSIAKSLSDMVRESFRDALFESVVPVMEKAHAQIFRQINQAFQNGTKEFAANTEAAARAAAERGGAAAAASLRSALERHSDALAAARAAPHHVLADVLRDTAHSVLEKELSWWREQARSTALASRAHSPATPSAHAHDRQMQVAQIQCQIANGDVNGAFQQALSASDLALVMCACRAAEPAAVFGPPCKLKQHVLLSLVQQLAADMGRDTHLKHKYLEEAVMNLDTSNPVTREHLPGVVRELQKQLVSFLAASPSHALARQLRMLLMATEALVKAAA